MPTRVQQRGSTGTGTTATLAFLSNVTAGNLLVVHIASAIAANTPTDTLTHTYLASQAETVVNTNNRTRLYYVPNCSAGANTVSVTFGSSSKWILNIAEYSGIKTTSPLLQVNAGTGFGTAANSGNITTTIADTLLLGSGTIENSAGDPIAPGTNWTEVLDTASGANTPATGHLEERMPNATGTYNATATLTSSTNWAWQIAAFEGAAASLDQEGFRFRNDDADEDSATWSAAQDTTITLPIETPKRLRVLVNATGNPTSKSLQLEYRKVGDPGWRKV